MLYSLYLELWKPGRQTLSFCNFSQLVLSNVSLLTVLFMADVVFFFWLEICVEVDVDRITFVLPPSYFFVPTHNSLFNTSDSYL